MQESFTILCDVRYFPEQAFRLATEWSKAFNKPISLLSLVSDEQERSGVESVHRKWKQEKEDVFLTYCKTGSLPFLSLILNELDVAILIIPLAKQTRFYRVMPLLSACRDLRMPYVFIKEGFSLIACRRWLIPVGFLPEEKEKGVIASSFGRFYPSSFDILLANDYGPRAARNAEAIQTLLTKFSIPYRLSKGRKDSFGIQQEAVMRASQGEADIVVLTASREYGLDDLLFGPPERKMIVNSRVPLLILNPRDDLYVLCG
ncbi:universal stress protein [Microbacter margulisiae]|uniref:Nucleotide-binding universal stress UspA family protein n=1 Tax=Microbacter margulisiae TaxID=1350067 RepID=A0A7W5H165_9PORP|nr:universal stress protein [Microbacter margulisiae]MBB3187263.1 nucleotide-binding universal stress UspA family protein [Microbacter margulisiae]